MSEYYDTLGVAKDADDKALKSAFRKKAMEYHPDRNPDDPAAEAMFKQVTEAYEILSDPDKRAAYDRYGKAAFENGGAGSGGFGGRNPEDVFGDVFGDVFSEFFGGARGRQRRGPARGADLRYDYDITLEEAFAGKNAEITVPGTETCDRCDGSRAEPGTSAETCDTCGGTGRVRAQQGFFTMERTCPRCQGTGQIIPKPCKKCGGRGVVRKDRTLQVNIPAGIEDGQRIRLSGEGEPGAQGGPKGDLYIFVGVLDHDIFERDGTTLYARAAVPMMKAALGGDFEMPTIDGGRTRIQIPEGSQTGKRLRLKGKGMPSLRGGPAGDLYVELFVETPRNLTARQKEILAEFSDECSEKSHPESNGFFNKVKRFFDADEAL
ncbi:MAG: molecular chaperone DnaJ [Pseudomonadota bacterium]